MNKVERFSHVDHPDISIKEKFDIQLGSSRNDEDRLADVLQNKTIELKTERFQWEQTGNIFIEYESRGKPSGLAVTEADFWCHELARGDETLGYIIIPTDRLKQICRQHYRLNKKDGAGDEKAQRGVVLKLRDLLVALGK
jgi:hypothetical protein